MSLETRPIPNGLLAFVAGRCVAGLGRHWYRPWLYPLYTPSGRQVLQEFPFDHPFHNGCFVGQHPVRLGERVANFWAVPPQREPGDEVFVHVGRVEVMELALPVMRCTWRDEHGSPILDEERQVQLAVRDGATVCEITSRKIAAYGALEFPATKFGGICVRVDPQLLPAAGGRIVGRHDAVSPYVAYENDRFGLALAADGSAPWFVREYGFASFNPTWKRALSLAPGEAWEVCLTLVAYDGALPSWIASSR